MGGVRLDEYTTIDENILALIDTVDGTIRNNDKLTISELYTDSKPLINPASVLWINGNYIKFLGKTEIETVDPVTTLEVVDGTVFIIISDAGIAAFTATPPTWSDTKQGWYGTGLLIDYKYSPYQITKTGLTYPGKYLAYRNQYSKQIYVNSDSAERSTTQVGPTLEIESNLFLEVPLNKGDIWNIYCLGNYANLETIASVGTFVLSLNTTSVSSTFYFDRNSQPFFYVTPIQSNSSDTDKIYMNSSQLSAMKGTLIGNESETVTIKMSWAVGGASNIAYTKDRVMIAVKI